MFITMFVTLCHYLTGSALDEMDKTGITLHHRRLGQRARRKLAEQAFGGGAKHLAPSDNHPGSAAAQRGAAAAAAAAAAQAAASLDQLRGGGAPHTARTSGADGPVHPLAAAASEPSSAATCLTRRVTAMLSACH